MAYFNYAKKLIAGLMSVVLVVALVPFSAYAGEGEDSVIPNGSNEVFEENTSANEDIEDTGQETDQKATGEEPNEGSMGEEPEGSTKDEDPVLDDLQAEGEQGIRPLGEAAETEDEMTVLNETVSVNYSAHVAYSGWQKPVSDGETAGTTGKSRAIEALRISLSEGSVEYSAHVQNVGWTGFVSDGAIGGTTGRSLRMEAVKIQLKDEAASLYDIYYQVHSANFGWLGWAKNGEPAGTAGYSYRLEAIKIVVVEKGGAAPGNTSNAFVEQVLSYQAHVQNIGWQATKYAGATAGTTGKSYRVEALRINAKSSVYSGSVKYQAHVQNIGWQDAKSSGAIAGTTGKSYRVEAIRINLTGDLAKKYDIYYRVHVQNFGWLNWASNGADAGSAGFSMRVEAVQIKLMEKGEPAPGSTKRPYVTLSYDYESKAAADSSWQSTKTSGATSGSTGKSKALQQIKMQISNSTVSGDIQYSTNLAKVGWTNYVSGGTVSGDGTNNIETIRIKLTGDLASYFDVYYRVHSQTAGWLGWAKNGAYAGTTGYGFHVEAYQVKIVAKGSAAPGSTSWAHRKSTTGDYAFDVQIANIAAKNGNNLRRCFDYVATYKYINQSKYPTGDWAVPFAKQMLANNGGNCYRFAALFCCLAQYLGYDAKVVSGWVPSRSGQSAHGWVEMKINGAIYVCDPVEERAYPQYNWYMNTYANSPFVYHKW